MEGGQQVSKTLKLWLSQNSGTVPKAQDCPRLSGLWDWEIYSIVLGLWIFGTVPMSRDCSRLLGQSQKPGTVPSFWVSEIKKYTPWCWDSGYLRQSQRPVTVQASRTVPKARTVPSFWVSEIEKYTPWCWDSGSFLIHPNNFTHDLLKHVGLSVLGTVPKA